MRRMTRRGGGLLALVAVLACGRTRSNRDEPSTDASNVKGGTVATGFDTSSSNDTAGASGGVTATGDTAGVGGTDSASSSSASASGGNTSGSSAGGVSAGAAGEPGIGGSSGSPEPSCQAFVRVFEEESCVECRRMADTTCEIHLRQTEMTCSGSYACFRRHCALDCYDDCEKDSCACRESCLPAGPNECRKAFDTLMDCYAELCGDC